MPTPQRSCTASTSSRGLLAIRMPAVAAAAISAAPARRASPTIPTIASAVRRTGSGWSAPDSRSPSPSLVTSARSTIVRQTSPARRSPTCSLTELVPMSITAKRTGSKPTRVFSPRAAQTFGRSDSASSRSVAETSAGSSFSIATVRADRPPTDISETSVMQPPTWKWERRLCTWTEVRLGFGRTSSLTSSSSVYDSEPSSRGAAPSADSAVETSSAPRGKGFFKTGRHCSSPSVLTASSSFTSKRPSRIFTEASLSSERR